MMQSTQHTQQQLIQEIHQLKVDKTKEKGSQHNLENVIDKKETSEGGCLQNAEPWFVTMGHDNARTREDQNAKGKTFLEKATIPNEVAQQTLS